MATNNNATVNHTASEHIAKLFVGGMHLGIRPQGYYREAGKKLARNSKGFSSFVNAEVSFIKSRLMNGFIDALRKRGAPAGVKVKFDPYKILIDRSYRTKILKVKGAQASATSEILSTVLGEIDSAYTENSAGAKKVIAKAKSQKVFGKGK